METESKSAGRGRTIACRIVAGVFAAFAIVSSIAFTVPVFTDADDKVHSFHNLGSFPSFVFLLGFALVIIAIDVHDVVALRVAWATAAGSVVASIIGQDFIDGTYYLVPIVLIVVTILSPVRGELGRFGSPNVAMLCLAVIAAIPAIVYAWDNARIMLQHDPMTDTTGHWKFHHWSGIAGAALGLVLAAVAVAFRREGDRMWPWVVGLSTMVFGVVGIVYADDVRYPSSIGSLWGVVVLFVGLIYIVVAEASARRRETDAMPDAVP